jgi:hypothetical protein
VTKSDKIEMPNVLQKNQRNTPKILVGCRFLVFLICGFVKSDGVFPDNAPDLLFLAIAAANLASIGQMGQFWINWLCFCTP